VTEVFITALGKFLPGEPVPNERMEDFLGRIGGKPSRARERVLRQNGIRSRHYAIDTSQRTLFRNSEMAAKAIEDALGRSGATFEQVDFLAAATAQGDLLVPGFASQVHAELRGHPLEVASVHGVCASGMMALKSAFLQVRVGDKARAVACASELPSRLFKASRYESQGAVIEDGTLPFDVEFLRWMLSDGAGAAVLEPRPRETGRSLRIEWIELASHAHAQELCMYAGANKAQGETGPSWLDYPSFEAAAREGAINLKQDIRLLDRMVQLGVAGFFELIERGRVEPAALDWIVCHHSSHFFKGRIVELLRQGGLIIPEERWFTNLYTKGNVGSASPFVLLEELVNDGPVRDGQKIFLMIPESGRFITSYALLTIVDRGTRARPAPPPPEPAAPELKVADPRAQSLVRRLTQVWVDFETQLSRVPVIVRLDSGRITIDDYRGLLVNLRQQVIEGSRWIARAASSLTPELFSLRSLFLQHARDESRDYQMLERDFVSVGGALEAIQRGEKNVGSEALSAWMFHRASQENPLDLLGAMFIIEGLGNRLARRWGEQIRDTLGLTDAQVSFLLYHGANDATHFEKLETALGSGVLTEALCDRIVKTAKVTARLYRLQLEELGNL
jgi:3-oxoacyl-[acyl-carrier-protein] synthase-3